MLQYDNRGDPLLTFLIAFVAQLLYLLTAPQRDTRVFLSTEHLHHARFGRGRCPSPGARGDPADGKHHRPPASVRAPCEDAPCSTVVALVSLLFCAVSISFSLGGLGSPSLTWDPRGWQACVTARGRRRASGAMKWRQQRQQQQQQQQRQQRRQRRHMATPFYRMTCAGLRRRPAWIGRFPT